MKKIKLSILSAAILLTSASCSKDYLETSPTDKVSSEVAFSSITSAKAALSGVYRFMFERTDVVSVNLQNKPGITGILLGADFMGEDIGISTGNWYGVTGEGNWQGGRTDNHNITQYYYRTYYKMIGDVNQIIANIDNIVASQSDKDAVLSQALTLRAYAYSYLVQFYGKRYDATKAVNDQLGVPLVLKPEDLTLPRSTVKEVYDVIIADLDKAISLGVTSRTNKSLTNVFVAKGLRARVALTMQDYTNAKKYAKEVIDSKSFPLLSAEDYQKGFNDASLSEFMWATMPTQDQDDAFGSFFAQIAYNANTSFMRANPKRINAELYNLISATDIRKKMWEPKPTAENFPLPTANFARQEYMSRKFAVKAAGTALGDVPLMRSAEMYLILAEAHASLGETTQAQDALFDLVKVRDAQAIKSTKTDNALLEEIWVNRRVELWGEGFRFFDLKRLNQTMDRNGVSNFVSTSVSNLMKVDAGDEKWQFLFPRAELDANPEIVQND
ncbi:RagB/SusD family nutrient uptake outer membrane protein [Sphingobacterium bovistauri]|uniref:RagB/SusD family nutrient uptake outer membrane protein n=1 Tax=Sphingobacterium bovistauri TaxID=2781959 RepID=A0ABS7Z5Z0_9SPHI|nr:RagB/SusD family nutrient uptake outer membrane protein [Sphingobacterium bovistauri]MCA5004344.1 RagB/SusD family nutrient uptake outer membrane protein [Sphingobacterium bovistauri]